MKQLPVLVLALAALSSQALEVTRLSPQGEAAPVSQVVVKFDEAVVNFGDAGAPAPLTLGCNNTPAAQGTGRWTSEREWVFDFANELPPGTACTLQLRSGIQSLKGTAFKGPSRYQFNTGGPFVQNIWPQEDSPIDEEQFFILQFNGPATPTSVQASVSCQAEGLGERVAVRLIDGQQRAALLKSEGLTRTANQAPLNWVTLACNRRLSPASKVQLVVGPGLATPGQAQGVSTLEKRFNFQVHEPFEASFACERENAQSACLPIRPMRISFNTPVSRKLAEGIRLTSQNATFAPRFEAHDGQGDVQSVTFASVLPEQTRFTLSLPNDFKDSAGRTLRNAGSFPMAVATGLLPPLAKFGAAPFGVVERLAEPTGAALLPVTLRYIESARTGGQVSTWQPTTDADIMAWFAKVQRYDNATVPRKTATNDIKGSLPKALETGDRDEVQTRMVSLLHGQPGVKTLDLPQGAGDAATAKAGRPFEVVGIPLPAGFHVVEIASPRLGSALLDERHGDPRPMFVRTSALVTNLGVHFKLGRDNALAWVTTLDKGQPVVQARVRVSDCRGREVASATTNAQGIATFKSISPEAPTCRGDNYASQAYFVSARAMQRAGGSANGVEDLAFTWSNWHRGIEPWRFNLPTSQAARPDARAHTIFDRTLVRAGETVSMKHILRTETATGFGLVTVPPGTLVVTHLGSGQQSTQPLVWRKTATGGHSAESSFAVPPAAKLGVYEVELRGLERERSFSSGQFRVEEFRLPVLEGRVSTTDKKALVNVTAVPLDVQVNYVAGGGAARLPVRVSAMVRGKTLSFDDFEDFSFSAPRAARENSRADDDEPTDAPPDARIIADKLPLTLDKLGGGKLTLGNIVPAQAVQELLIEATYADPSGEIQTLRSSQTLWPAAVVAGIKTEGWVSSNQKIRFQALALSLSGKPQAGVALDVRAVSRIVTSSRKRMVGGFYTYDNSTTVKDLGSVCRGPSDARGLLLCDTALREAGEVELIVTAKDAAGHASQAASSVYVTRQGELWFGGENHDRMDLLPEKKSYQPGETAKFQVRMPFRFATALLTVEREGVIQSQVVQLSGQDPTVEVKIKDSWGPNVYVSVLALRGRLRDVPWYSFFTWGYQAPREWWTSFWVEGREYVAPTALVDLSKPAFRLGVAEIRVGTAAHQLKVSVTANKESYPVRGQAQVSLDVTLPNGRPAAGAEVALAAVD
ncbi:MAG: MG2 domain-containing protein, partial [Rhodoferax sp.]|nr:MG2 domain-containing protein [Rhodoferax sp.]